MSTAQYDTSRECGSCNHPSADHDPIALRFCAATGNGALARGCICASARIEQPVFASGVR